MQTALHVATNTTGAVKVSAEITDSSNKWGMLQGVRSVGRFGIASSRKIGEKEEEEEQAVCDDTLEEIEDTGLTGA